MTKKSSQPAGFRINTNTIIGAVATVLSGVILWMLTNAMATAKENNKIVTKIDTTLPFVQSSVNDVKQSVAEVKQTVANVQSVMVTRSEMDNKQQRTETAIKDVKDEQTRLRNELPVPKK